VYVEGTIDQVALTKTGGHMTVQINDITIFIPAQATGDLVLKKGENISAYGIVETYRGKKEIMVNFAEDIRFAK